MEQKNLGDLVFGDNFLNIAPKTVIHDNLISLGATSFKFQLFQISV